METNNIASHFNIFDICVSFIIKYSPHKDKYVRAKQFNHLTIFRDPSLLTGISILCK